MKQQDWRFPVRALAVLAVVAAACSSASMGGGIAGTSRVLGAISGFGSIVVNGIEFDVESATVTIDGEPSTPADLRLGMVAAVTGTVDSDHLTGVAESVNVELLLQGPVASVDPSSGTIGALGQLILTSSTTVFDGTSLDRLIPGDAIAVSGFFDAEGRIRASRISPPLEPEIALAGTIQNLDPAQSTFHLNDLVVRYDAAIIKNAPPEGLADGLLVEVDADEAPQGNVLEAAEVDVLGSFLTGEEGDLLEVEGFVTKIASPTEFVLNATQSVRIDAQTRFVGGTASDVILNASVEVEGTSDAAGTLVASEVEFAPPP